MSKEAMTLALEALENSIDLVSQEARNAEELYGKYPTRLPRIQGLLAFEVAHEKAITALREALASGAIEQPAQFVAWMEMVVANLVREGINKHKARELAQHFYTSPQPAQRKPLTRAAISDARDYLNTNDKAMWVLGWNECVEAHNIKENK